jgi:hypothetical protein
MGLHNSALFTRQVAEVAWGIGSRINFLEPGKVYFYTIRFSSLRI